MNSKNLNYYYYVEYYDGVRFNEPDSKDTQSKLQERNNELCNYEANNDSLMASLDVNLAPQSIELQTVYPGLLIGTGLAHGFGGKGEAALGLCLDYVTGMPYIPGSSVKGTLRSAFTEKEYILETLKSIINNNDNAISDEEIKIVNNAGDEFIRKLEAGIFGKPIKDETIISNPREEDIFFDAIVTSTGKLLAVDAITPHRMDSELLELANPNPLTLIRIRPGVKFKFQFALKPKTLGISADLKLKLFTQILLDMGIGAKTNVGYGQLEAPTERNANTNTNTNLEAAGNRNNRDNNQRNNSNNGSLYSTGTTQTQSSQILMFRKNGVCPKCKRKTAVRYAERDSKVGVCDKCKTEVLLSEVK